MNEKLTMAKDELARQLRKISITITLIVHLLYIGYLSYSLLRGIGNRIINIALIIGTGVFLIVYLILQLFENRKKRLKSTKRYYKRFKLITKLFTTATAIYSLITASKAVSPFATFISVSGAVILLIKILFELISSLIARKAKQIKEERTSKREKKKLQKLIDEMKITEEACSITMDDLE